MFGYVYETTNLVDGKKYIGRCKSEIFLGEKYLGSGTNNPMYGRHHSEESKLKNRLSNQDKKWINNGLVNKTCKINEVESYLKDGWKLGMLPRKKHKV